MINKRTNPPGSLRPLSPRSIVLSVLLGSHPPSMPVGPLLAFTSLFGLSDGSVRTALSRMVAAGDLETADGVYRLSGRLLARQSEQDAGRRTPTDPWDGTWWFAVVLADRRSVSERRSFRARAVGARLGELRPDLWLRPANIEVPLDLPDVVLTRGELVTGDADQLVERLWDTTGLDAIARTHGAALDDAARALAATEHDAVLADTFVTLAAAQRFLRTEPQLPSELDAGTGAADLRARYDAVEAEFRRRLAAFLTRRQYRRAVS